MAHSVVLQGLMTSYKRKKMHKYTHTLSTSTKNPTFKT